MRFRHSIKIQRLNFDTRREGIHGERREIDWTMSVALCHNGRISALSNG